MRTLIWLVVLSILVGGWLQLFFPALAHVVLPSYPSGGFQPPSVAVRDAFSVVVVGFIVAYAIALSQKRT